MEIKKSGQTKQLLTVTTAEDDKESAMWEQAVALSRIADALEAFGRHVEVCEHYNLILSQCSRCR